MYLRGIFELLDVMKLDMANFHIQQMRPHIQLKSIQYERQKFQEFLESQSSNGFTSLDMKWILISFLFCFRAFISRWTRTHKSMA